MRTVVSCEEMRRLSDAAREAGRRLGFVPTMGALHAGHLSLVERARAECDEVVLSIYVNPLQFGPREDFAAYPRDLERDAALARDACVSILFAPAQEEMRPADHSTFVEVTELQDTLCGRSRPGHFRGVATIVAQLFGVVRPHRAYFGEKDAQQLRIIQRMVRDLKMDLAVVGCPIVREADGLAMSSRNAYLTPDERRAAPVVHAALRAAAERAAGGESDVGRLVAATRQIIEQEPLARIDYVEAVDDETLQPAVALGRAPVLLAAAVYFGKARLIDNVVLRFFD